MIIDTNIFLEFLLEQNNSEKCKNFLNKTVSGEVKAIVSDFTIDSVVIIMERNKTPLNFIKAFLKKILSSKGIKIYPINMKDRMNCLSLMEKYKIDYEDSLILQSALSTKSSEIISFDKHFDKIKEIKRIEPK